MQTAAEAPTRPTAAAEPIYTPSFPYDVVAYVLMQNLSTPSHTVHRQVVRDAQQRMFWRLFPMNGKPSPWRTGDPR